jgi:hypothetical protein
VVLLINKKILDKNKEDLEKEIKKVLVKSK